jgi:hypothetical protein
MGMLHRVAIFGEVQPRTKYSRTTRHCTSAGGCFNKTGICAGKVTMFLRIALRRAELPGCTGVFIGASLWISVVFRFSSIKCIEKSRPTGIKMA